jgi:glycosyltransferase involved in cell wall biosynthesis
VFSLDKGKPLVVACIPAFCEEATIAKVILSAQEHVDKVVVCDDGSTDMTGAIAEKLGAIVVRHDENLGKGNALRTLFGAAEKLDADVVVLLDADGQHNPDEIPSLIEPILQAKADLVVGSRFLNGKEIEAPFYRRSGLKFLNFLHKKTNGSVISDSQCGFRALSKKAMYALSSFEIGGYGVDMEMLSLAQKNGMIIAEVPVEVKYKGLTSTSKKAPLSHGWELLTNILKMIVEDRPLKYLGFPGVMLVLLGMLAAIYMVLSFDAARSLSVRAMVVAMGALASGLILIVAALILHVLKRINKKLEDLTNQP